MHNFLVALWAVAPVLAVLALMCLGAWLGSLGYGEEEGA